MCEVVYASMCVCLGVRMELLLVVLGESVAHIGLDPRRPIVRVQARLVQQPVGGRGKRGRGVEKGRVGRWRCDVKADKEVLWREERRGRRV